MGKVVKKILQKLGNFLPKYAFLCVFHVSLSKNSYKRAILHKHRYLPPSDNFHGPKYEFSNSPDFPPGKETKVHSHENIANFI